MHGFYIFQASYIACHLKVSNALNSGGKLKLFFYYFPLDIKGLWSLNRD